MKSGTATARSTGPNRCTQAWNLNEYAPGLSFAYMYAEDRTRYSTEQDALIYIAVNAYWEEQRYTLPLLPRGFRWRLAFEAGGVSTDPGCESLLEDQSALLLGPRSSAVLIGRADG